MRPWARTTVLAKTPPASQSADRTCKKSIQLVTVGVMVFPRRNFTIGLLRWAGLPQRPGRGAGYLAEWGVSCWPGL